MKFSRIAVAVSTWRTSVDYRAIVERLVNFLADQECVQRVFIEERLAQQLAQHDVHLRTPCLELISSLKDCVASLDLVIVIGGDGSILRVGRIALGTSVPIIGINKGKLGFLADLNVHNFEAHLLDVFAGQYTVEKRSILKASHYDEKGDIVPAYFGDSHEVELVYGLNELLVQGDGRMLCVEVSISKQHTFQQCGDGIMVATPTGSTGHSLSAGGPIVAPDVPAMCIVPMCPHNLSSRPVIINAGNEVTIKVLNDDDDVAFWCIDGVKISTVNKGHRIETSLLPSAFTLLHSYHYRFLASCADKLGWERLS